MEVLDTSRDNTHSEEMEKKAGIVDEEATSDSSSSSDDDDEDKHHIPNGNAENKQGVIDQVRDYKRRDKALHRQHRGMMQWKVSCGIMSQCLEWSQELG